MKKKQGFTLIEMVVVTAAIAMIMVALVSVVITTFRSQNQTKSSSKVVSGGNWILNEIKRNVLSSNGRSITCLSNSSIGLTNVHDGESTTISCENDRIASESANNGTIYLDNSDVSITDCSQFVSCSTLPSLEVSTISFNFGVGSSTIGIEANQSFEIDISVRN